MTADDYTYLAEVWEGETVDHPASLWRGRSGEPEEYLSLIDWTWHPADRVIPPHPDILVSICPEQVEKLLADHRSFSKYWVLHETRNSGEQEISVYRQRRNPGRRVDEVFGRDNEWIPTHDITDFQVGGPHDTLDLEAINAATAERLIQQTSGIFGATSLEPRFPDSPQMKGFTA